MTVYFDMHIRDDVDAPGYAGVAKVGERTPVVGEQASKVAFDRTLEVIGGRQIERVEFIHRFGNNADQKEYRGAVLYRDASTPHPTPHVHVLNALLGYDGSGPAFSRMIMNHLGMADPVFDQMNADVSRHYPYTVLALSVRGKWQYSREKQVAHPLCDL